MHRSRWQNRKAQSLRLGVALIILAALLPLQHTGTALARISGAGAITAETATLTYIGTSDPGQLTGIASNLAAPHVAGAAHGRVTPFLTPHRTGVRQAATSAMPRLAGATLQQSADTAQGLTLSGAGISLGGFPSLSAADQFATHAPLVGGALADLEPPDDAVCAGPNQQIAQLINNVGAVFGPHGTRLQGPFTLESFFHEAPPFGLSDPRCAYDPVAHAFYAEEWASAFNASGMVVASHIDLAINLSDDATRPWSIFRLDVSDTNIAGCPCLPDYTQLGFDQKGIFLSTNQFTSDYLSNPSPYVEDRITVIGKSALFSYLQSQNPLAPLPRVFTYRLPNDFTVQPAVSYDPVTRMDAAQEYFVESLDLFGAGSNQLAVFAFSNEAAFDGSKSPGALISTTIGSEAYSNPPAAVQKGFYGVVTLDDDRVLQVVNAGGALWAVLTTGVTFGAVDTDFVRAGAAWFKLIPSDTGGLVSATIAAQNYVAAPFGYFSYPALMVNNAGRAAMVLSLFQADPSYPYTGLTYPQVGVAYGPSFNNLKVVAQSTLPDIGFTTVLFPPLDFGGIPDFIAGGGRWGDYSAATVDPAGSVVYLNTQWIPGPATSGSEANWGTFMATFRP